MRHRLMIILSAGLFVVIAILFVLLCHLNRKQHLVNMESIEADYLRVLSQESANLRERIRTLENEAFGVFDQQELSFDSCRTNRLFIRHGNVFVPAGIADVPPAGDVPPDVARKSLLWGIGLEYSGEMDRAREQLDKASRITLKTAGDLDVRLSALAELLKISGYRNHSILFSMFYSLFLHPDLRLDADRVAEMDGVLRGKIAQYDMLKAQSDEMWKTAAAISQVSSNRPAPFRTVCDGQVLSVNALDQACLLSIEAFRRDIGNVTIKVTTTDPGAGAAVSRKMNYPPVYVWIPAGGLDVRKHSAEKAYFLTKVMLGILCLVFAAMAGGVGLLIKRQHEVALLRSSFVSTVTHELRTPMALIRLYAESLAGANIQAGAKDRYTRAIMAETDRLTALVNNVLDFSRLENGTLKLNICDTDVSKICNEVLDSFGFLMDKEKIILDRNIEPGLMALVDPVAFTQVVFNLVDNAVKYSGGSQKVEVEMLSEADKVCLRVKDNGIGIPVSLKGRIFMPFARGDDSRVTSKRGTGIGLNITRQFLDRMQCSIRFFDNVPGGTVFEVMMAVGQDKVV